jgi:hypothetical protein
MYVVLKKRERRCREKKTGGQRISGRKGKGRRMRGRDQRGKKMKKDNMTEGPAVLITRVSHARGQAMTVLRPRRCENLRTQ